MNSLLRMLRIATAGAAALALSASLAACGADTPSGTGTPATIKVWVMGDDGKNFSNLVQDFTKNTNIKVEVDAIPWGSVNEKLTTAVASGNGPDVMQVGLSLLSTFQAAGALLDINQYVAAHPNLKTENFLDAVSADKLNPAGKVLSVPWISDTRILFYRTDILSQVGFSTPPKTWTQLRDYAVKLAARGKGQYGYYIPQWDAPLPIQFTWQAGGKVVDSSGKVTFDTPEFKQAADFYTSFYRQNLVPTASDFDQTQGFISGVTPMLISGPYLAKAIADQAPDLAGKWAVTTLPTEKAGTALFAGSNLGIWSKSTNVEASLKLLDYLSEPATQLKWYKVNGELPTVKTALADASLASDPNVAVYTKQLQNAQLLPVVPAWDQIQKKLLDSLNNIALKGADPNATLAQLNQDVASLQR